MWCGTEIDHTTKSFEDIHNRTDIYTHKNTTFETIVIAKIEKETHDTVSVYFIAENKKFYDYLPWQYLTLKMKVKGIKYYRYFSLSSSPHIDNFLRITVKVKWAVSKHFFHNAQVGDSILALLPEWEFTITPTTYQKKDYIMIAGGSGITAIWSMVKSILHSESSSTVKLFYACKSKEDIILQKEIKEVARMYPTLDIRYLISWERRLSRDDLVWEENTEYYICWPESLKKAALWYCIDIRVSSDNVHTENYADGYMPWFGVFSR
jgi:ring-1,2-phenylacetyl-CoA epoxidase subunit PaaE